MPEPAVARNVAAQREWYGEPLGDRVRRLVIAFDVSQTRLAAVLGLSPRDAQSTDERASGEDRAVLARMVLLERQVLVPAVASGDPAAIRAALQRVRDCRPTVGWDTPAEWAGDGMLLSALRTLADPDDLAAAAALLRERFPRRPSCCRERHGNRNRTAFRRWGSRPGRHQRGGGELVLSSLGSGCGPWWPASRG